MLTFSLIIYGIILDESFALEDITNANHVFTKGNKRIATNKSRTGVNCTQMNFV